MVLLKDIGVQLQNLQILSFCMQDSIESFFYYAVKYAQYIHDVIPVRNLLDENGLPTTPYYLATGRKPAVKHFRVFGCPAVFKRYEVSSDGKRIHNNYNQQGMRGIFVGIPDDASGWLFYVPIAKRSYISLDATFDESFISPLILPDLPYQGAINYVAQVIIY